MTSCLHPTHSPCMQYHMVVVSECILQKNYTFSNSFYVTLFHHILHSLVRSKEQLQVASEITLSSIKSLMGRMATILNIIFIMGKLSPHYDYGFRQTTSLLLTIYEQIGRSYNYLNSFCCLFVFMCVCRALQTEDMTTSLTVIAHNHFIHGYFENEKLIFSLLLALEVCTNKNTLFIVCMYLFIVHSLRLLMEEFLRMRKNF